MENHIVLITVKGIFTPLIAVLYFFSVIDEEFFKLGI